MKPPSSRPSETATQCLEVDHRSLDALLAQAEESAHAARFSDARRHLRELASSLARHIDAEERVLFPEIEGAEAGLRGPTSVMRAEHRELYALIDRIGREMAAADTAWAASVLSLKEMLLTHNTKEERMLYPMADAAAQKVGRSAALAERLRGALMRRPGGQP